MGSTPSGQEVSVALDALRSDATTWDQAAQSLSGPANTAADLNLTARDVSMWANDRGFDTTYNQARTKLEDVLKQAATNFGDIAQALRAAADIYEQEEQENLHRLKGIY